MRLELLIGMVASGKSTYALGRATDGALCISFDALTQMLHGGEYRYEQGLRECYRRMEEDLATRAILAGRDVVIDRTHLAKEARARWVAFKNNAMLPAGSWRTFSIVAVAFPVEAPEVHARRRFAADPRGRSYEEWLSVARHHFEQWQTEPLSEDEGFAEIIRMDGI